MTVEKTTRSPRPNPLHIRYGVYLVKEVKKGKVKEEGKRGR
jgi:hypothetical protein